MASAEGFERCSTLIWEIENFDLLLEMERQSGDGVVFPAWKVERNGENVWCLLYVCQSLSTIEFHIIQLQNGSAFNRCDVSIISSCGEVPLKKIPDEETFVIEEDAVFGDKIQSMLPNNTLTLRFRMLGEAMKNQEFRICSVLQSIQYLWNIQHCNSTNSCKTFIEQGNLLLRVFLIAKNRRIASMVVDIVPKEEICASFVDCTLSTTNVCERIKNKSCEFPFVKWTCDIENFPENEEKTNVQFRSIVSVHKVSQIIQHENASKAGSVPSARADDLLLLYREGTLSDATLNTEEKSFSAHRSILAARSPVFRAMFEKDEMSEGRSGVVDIDDVDSETVDRMLVFLYGEKLDDVLWEDALALYYAADKYDVLSLKQRCIDILKDGLAVDNACDALVLADTHSDEQLRKCVVDFINDHRKVFSSSKWEKLEESNPRLAMKIFREVCVKKEK